MRPIRILIRVCTYADDGRTLRVLTAAALLLGPGVR